MTMMRPNWVLRTLALAAAGLGVAATAGADPISYNRDIRPIFSEICFKCHGPDAAHRKGNLRLDLPEAAYGKGKSGELAIVPGSPAKSEIIRRVNELVALLDSLTGRIDSAWRDIDRSTQAILATAFRGELRP